MSAPIKISKEHSTDEQTHCHNCDCGYSDYAFNLEYNSHDDGWIYLCKECYAELKNGIAQMDEIEKARGEV